MATDPVIVQLRIPREPQGIAAVSATVESLAQRANMELGPRAALVAAAEEACRTTMNRVRSGETLGVILSGYMDRVEICLEYQGEPVPSVGLETFAALGAEGEAAPQATGLMLLTLVDRVQYQTESGTQRVTLVKYVPAAAAQ